MKEQAEEFRALFFDACRLRLRSDVPLATALSGGLDFERHRLHLGGARPPRRVEHAPKDWQRAFVACFIDTPYDERLYAKAVIDHTGMVPRYHDVDDHQALNNIEKVIFDHEGIYWRVYLGASSIYRAMRSAGIRVSIDGHGGDELIGGYRYFVERAIDAAAGSLDLRRYLDLRQVLAGQIGATAVSMCGGEVRRFARGQLARLRLLEALRSAVASCRSLAMWVHGSAMEPLLPPFHGPHRLYDEDADLRVVGMSPLQAMLFTWFHGSMLPTLLRVFDRASMAQGIEVRDAVHGLAIGDLLFCASGNQQGQRWLYQASVRQAMHGLLPEPIRLRTDKIGFIAPMEFGSWSR